MVPPFLFPFLSLLWSLSRLCSRSYVEVPFLPSRAFLLGGGGKREPHYIGIISPTSTPPSWANPGQPLASATAASRLSAAMTV